MTVKVEVAIVSIENKFCCVPTINCLGNLRGAPAFGFYVYLGCFALQRVPLVSCPFSVLWASKRSGDGQGKIQDYSQGVG